MTPMQQMLLGVGAKKKTYMDDVFSTYLYTGNGGANQIVNGIDNTEESMIWMKRRDSASHPHIHDTIRGGTNYLLTNSNGAAGTDNGYHINTFNNNGFTLQNSGGGTNANSGTYASWNFKSAPGFFDVVSFSSDENYSTKTINHNLGSVPGFIVIKKYSASYNWIVWHRDLDTNKYLLLNSSNAASTDSNQVITNATSTQFTIGADHNNGAGDWIAYLFAGGESGAATARSVLFAGNASNGNSQYSFLSSPNTDQLGDDTFALGTNDFTVECWVNPNSFASNSGNKGIWGLGHGSENLIVEVQSNGRINVIKDDSTLINTDNGALKLNEWTHVALVRHSNTIKLYLNGIQKTSGSLTASLDLGNGYEGLRVGNRLGTEHAGWRGYISNFRFVKGTAVYTSAFRVPTEPLTNISGTIALVCQNSAENVATVWPGGGTSVNNYGNETSSSDSPFDDPAAFTFGDSGDQGIIKCGSYVGNGSSTGPEINLGWEPQWIIYKCIDAAEHWLIRDSLRGIGAGTIMDPSLAPNTNGAESNGNRIELTATGFRLTSSHADSNNSGDKYAYVAIRRPDGYVGKPAEAGTDAFNVVYGNSSSTIPNFPSNFPVDMGIYKEPSNTYSWYLHTRLTGGKNLKTDSTDGNQAGSDGDATFDSNAGWGKFGYNTDKASWLWKRHAGFDVVTYEGTQTVQDIRHSMNKSPEMMWIKNRDSATYNWSVYHSGLGDNRFKLYLNTDNDYSNDQAAWNNTAPTSTHFTLGTDATANHNGSSYIAMLFSSVNGISKVGSYTGNGVKTGNVQTLGFQPRFILIKCTDTSSTSWMVFDTLLGINSGDDNLLKLNSDASTSAGDYIDLTSDGFDVVEDLSSVNGNNKKYIYYAHA